jgi:hypothetical protein
VEEQSGANPTMTKAFALLVSFLRIGQSVPVVEFFSETLRAFIRHYPNVLFARSTDYCQELCLDLLRACNSPLAAIREHTAALLFLLIRRDLPRVSHDVTIAISRTAGDLHRVCA